MEESVQLRALQRSDIDQILVWGADVPFCAANGWTLNLPEEKLRQHWTSIITDSRADFIRYGIVHQNPLVVYADLADIDCDEGRAELGYAIGDSSLWGRGLGFFGAALMLKVAFERLKLKRVTASVSVTNARSKRVLEKLKFTFEGIQEEETESGVREVMCLHQLLLEDFRDPTAKSENFQRVPIFSN